MGDMWVILNENNSDAWSNTCGWVDNDTYDIYTSAQKARCNLPLEGYWHKHGEIRWNYPQEAATHLTVGNLLRWIAGLHTELTNRGILPDGVSTETHQQLEILAVESECME